MKRPTSRQLDEELSSLLDGSLDPKRRARLEEALEIDAKLRARRDGLLASGNALRNLRSLPIDEGFWHRLRDRLPDRQSEDAFAVPRRLIPALLTAGALSCAALEVIILTQSREIVSVVSRTGEQVRHFYEETIGSSWLLPLHNRTDRDGVLEFAVYGTLPIDEDRTFLKVDNSSDSGFRINLGAAANRPRQITTDDLYREIRATEEQKKVVDSLLSIAQRRIESSVLLGENESLLIDPSIGEWSSAILASIASSLEPRQRIRFDRFLGTRGAPWTIDAQAAVSPDPPALLNMRLNAAPENERSFVVLRTDTVELRRLALVFEENRKNGARATSPRTGGSERSGDQAKRSPYPAPPIEIGSQNARNALQAAETELQRARRALQHVYGSSEDQSVTVVLSEAYRNAYVKAIQEYDGLVRRRHGIPARSLPALGDRVLRIRIRQEADAPDIPQSAVHIDVDSIIRRSLRAVPEIRERLRGISFPTPPDFDPADGVPIPTELRVVAGAGVDTIVILRANRRDRQLRPPENRRAAGATRSP